MVLSQFLDLYEKIHKAELSIYGDGHKEYAHRDADVHANFKRVGEALGLDPKLVLLVYLLKHMDGISAYCQGHKSQREDVRGRITDAKVYLSLLWAMVEEENDA